MVDVLAEKQSLISELCRKYGVRRLEVFGSAAERDRFDSQRSDVDLLVEYPAGHDLGPWLRDYFALRLELEALVGHRVDLVMSEAAKNRHFQQELERTRTPLYAC